MEPEKKSNGSFVGLVVIIIILIIGGIYIWMSSQKAVELQNTPNQDVAVLDALEMEADTTDTSTGVDTNTVE